MAEMLFLRVLMLLVSLAVLSSSWELTGYLHRHVSSDTLKFLQLPSLDSTE